MTVEDYGLISLVDVKSNQQQQQGEMTTEHGLIVG